MEDEESVDLSVERLIQTKLKPNETINVLSGSLENLFVGGSLGSITNYKQDCPVHAFKLMDGPIYQIEFFSALEILIVLQAGTLIEVNQETRNVATIMDNVTAFALNSDPLTSDPFTIELAIASGKTINICRKSTTKLEKCSRINCDGNIKTLAYARNTVCFATASYYFIYDTTTKSSLPLFPIDETVKPVICTINSHEFLLFGIGLAMFVTKEGTSIRPPLIFHQPSSSCVSHSSNLVVLGSTELQLYGIDDQRLEGTLKNTNEIRILACLEGKVLAANDSTVFTLKQAGFEKRIEKLEARGEFEKALKESEDEFRKNPSDIVVEKIQSLKEKLSLKYITDGNYEDALEILLEANVKPEKVIEYINIEDVDVTSDHLPPIVAFLKDYLLQVKNTVCADDRKKVDDTLYRLGIYSTDYTNWTPEQHLLKADLLRKRNHLHLSAKHFYAAGRVNRATSLWEEAMNKAAFRISDLLDSIEMSPNKEDNLSLIKWAFEKFPMETYQFLHDSTILTKVECCDVFEKNKEIFEKYIQKNLDVPELQSRILCYFIDKSFEGESASRFTLRRLICEFTLRTGRVHYEVAVKLKKPGFELEHLMTNSNPTLQEATEVLSSLLKEKDYDNAESYVELHLETHKSLLETLFSYYKQDGETLFQNRGMKFLDCINPSQNVRELLKEIPATFKFNEISNFVKRAVAVRQSRNSADYITRVTQSYLIRKKESEQMDSKPIIIEENEKCKVCDEELELKPGNLVHLPTGYVVHSKCFRNPRLCPVTNHVF